MGAEKYPKKKKLRKFLLGLKAAGMKIDLLNFTQFCRLLTHALAEDKRWKLYTRMCKEMRLSRRGQALPENILEHTGIDTPLLGGAMLAIEKKAGTLLSYDLLPLAFTLHDIPEGIALKGDVDYTLKNKDIDEEENGAFSLMVSLFDDDAREYFNAAYRIVQDGGLAKRAGAALQSISLDAQFFITVEVAGYISRVFFEVKAGNIVFANVFWGHLKELRHGRRTFISFERFIAPHISFMEETMKKYFDSDWNHWRGKITDLSFG